MAELALARSKRVLDFGVDARLDRLELIDERLQRPALVQGLTLARIMAMCQQVVRAQLLDFVSLFNTPIARVGKDDLFLPMQQGMCLRDVVDVGRSGRDGVHQPRVGIHANVLLHAEVPLLTFFLGLVHLGVALPVLVLGRAGRGNQGGIDHRAALEHQAARHQAGVDGGQNLRCQLVLLQQVTKAQDGALIGQAGDACIKSSKLTVQRHVVQGLFHSRVGMTKELLQQVNAQHRLQPQRTVALSCPQAHAGQSGSADRPRGSLAPSHRGTLAYASAWWPTRIRSGQG